MVISAEKIKKRQNICGATFIALYVLNVLVLLLKYIGVMSPSTTWYIYGFGILMIWCYIMLLSLSSNAIAEIFAVCQIGLTTFYSVILPIVAGREYNESIYSGVMLIICVAFAVFSLYMWSVLMNNCNFKTHEIRWIVFLPIPYLINIATYISLYQGIFGESSRFLDWSVNNNMCQIISWLMMIYSALGSWQLSHAECYSARIDDYSFPSWTPFNRYTLAYLFAVVAIYLIF